MAPSAGNKAADVRVAPLLEDDVPASFAVLSASFGHDAPFVNAYYPGHDTPAGRARGTARLAAWRRASALSADSTFLKAVIPQDSDGDGGGERIIGFAVWTLMREPPPSEIGVAEPDPEAAWPDPHDREFITRLWRDYVVPRTQAVKASEGKGVYSESSRVAGTRTSLSCQICRGREIERGRIEEILASLTKHTVLEFLAVHPEYQRLGAGTALVKWGTKAADENGVRVSFLSPRPSF